MIVVDASAALSLVLPSQATQAAGAFFLGDTTRRIAPAIFAFEVRNALLRFERRGAIQPSQVDEASATIETLAELHPWRAAPADFVRQLALARREGLSLFDTAYLDLALREGAALASRDGPLLDAARRQGIEVRDLR